MPSSPCFLFKNSYEFKPKEEIDSIPNYVRGIYVLFNGPPDAKGDRDVVYIGMARGESSGAKGRLRKHCQDKGKEWSHFSVFQVWDNITEAQVEELEGLFRHIYRRDAQANRFNIQKKYAPLDLIRRKTADEWI